MEDTKSQDYTGLDTNTITTHEVEHNNAVYENIDDKSIDRNKSKSGVPVWVTVVSCFIVGLLASIVTAVICLLVVAPSKGHDELLTITQCNMTTAVIDGGLRNEGKDNGSESECQKNTAFTLEVWSEGYSETGTEWDKPLFYINGHAIPGAPKGRGWNIVVLDRLHLNVLSTKHVDTYGDPTTDVILRDYLETEIALNSVVLGAIWDTAVPREKRVRESAYYSQLAFLLAPTSYKVGEAALRDAYAFIGLKGFECEERPSWITDYINVYENTDMTYGTSPVHVTAHIPPLACSTK